MDLAAIRAFLTIAEEGHLTRAAGRLHRTQPAVSAQLGRLEDALGHTLFHRTPKGMVLTEAGALFQPYAINAVGRLSDGQEVLDRLAGLETGALSLGGGATATTYLLPKILGAFHARYPEIQLFVREQGSTAVLEGLEADDLDIGLVTLAAGIPTQGPSECGRVHLRPWITDELRLIVPPGHRLEGKKSFRWKDLEGVGLVQFEAGSAVRALIDKRLEASGVAASVVMELRSIETIKQMVAQGVGAGFVSRYALPSPETGLRCADGPLTRHLAIARRKDRPPNLASEAFLALLLASETDAAPDT